jgi:hypothetical protein
MRCSAVAIRRRGRLLEDGTSGFEQIEPPVLPSETRPAVSALTEDVGFLRSKTRAIHEDVGNLHRKTVFAEWNNLTNRRARGGMLDMLNDLADLGFAWRDIARMIGVSVPAIQKWRRGERTTGDNRRRVASLLAACDIISEGHGIHEVASWMEMPLREHVPVTPMDLWASEHVDLVFDLAGGHVDVEDILTTFDPDWRDRYRSDFEVFKAGDQKLSIRLKGQ